MVQRYNILGRYTNQCLCLCSHAWSVEVSYGKIRVRPSGYLGNGSGTYKVSSKTITTYVSGKEYAVYTVNSLNGNKAGLTLRMGGESLQMRVEKQY